VSCNTLEGYTHLNIQLRFASASRAFLAIALLGLVALPGLA
jgi:hypothetical protein